MSGCGFSATVAPQDGPPIDMIDAPPMSEPFVIPRIAGARGVWRFNEGSGTSVIDRIATPLPMHMTVETEAAVTWVSGGLRLDSRVTIATAASPHVSNDISVSKAFTVEAWVSTANLTQGLDGSVDGAPDHATIVNVSGSIVSFSGLIGQIGDKWVGRARSSATGTNALPEIETMPGKAKADTVTHLVLVANGTSRILYVDGSPFTSTPSGVGVVDWDPSYPIRVGDSGAAGYDRTWLGTIYFLAIYDRALLQGEVQQNRDAGYQCPEC